METIPPLRQNLDHGSGRGVHLKEEPIMSIHIEIPEPLAEKVSQAAKPQAKSAHDFVLETVEHTLAGSSVSETPSNGDTNVDPLLGLLSHEPELATFIEDSAMHAREVRPLRTVCD
jgi:hypothetical protein